MDSTSYGFNINYQTDSKKIDVTTFNSEKTLLIVEIWRNTQKWQEGKIFSFFYRNEFILCSIEDYNFLHQTRCYDIEMDMDKFYPLYELANRVGSASDKAEQILLADALSEQFNTVLKCETVA